jgi:hypothetical protein
VSWEDLKVWAVIGMLSRGFIKVMKEFLEKDPLNYKKCYTVRDSEGVSGDNSLRKP